MSRTTPSVQLWKMMLLWITFDNLTIIFYTFSLQAVAAAVIVYTGSILCSTVLRTHSPKLSYVHKSEDASGCSYTNKLWVKQLLKTAVLIKTEAYLFHQMDVRHETYSDDTEVCVYCLSNYLPLLLPPSLWFVWLAGIVSRSYRDQ